MATILAMDILRSTEGRDSTHSWAPRLRYKCGSSVDRAASHDWSEALAPGNEGK